MAGKVRKDDTGNQTKQSLPVDRGWAWGVLIGGFIESIITIGIMKSTGILFVELQERFDSNSAMTSLISTVQNSTYSVSALFITVIVLRIISCRTAVLIGSVLSCTAHIITAFAEHIHTVMFSMGVLHGIGLAFLLPPMPLMLGRYFEKRRGFANSFAISGGGVGGLIFAPLLTMMFKTFSFTGTFLIIGGFYMQCCVSALLFRPFSFYKNKSINRNEPMASGSLMSDYKETETSPDCKDRQRLQADDIQEPKSSHSSPKCSGNLLVHREESVNTNSCMYSHPHHETQNRIHVLELQQQSKSCFPLGMDNSGTHELLPFTRPRTRTTSSIRSVTSSVINTFSRSQTSLYASTDILPISLIHAASKANNTVSEASSEEPSGCSKEMGALAKVFDLSLFKNPLFILIMICTSLLCPSSLLLGIYLAPYAKETGLTPSQIAMLLTIVAVIDICSRISVGLIADRGWCRRSTIIGVACVLLGCVVHLLRFLDGLHGFIAFSVVLGLFSGVYFSLYSVVLVDYLTLDKLQSSLGFTTLFNGAAIAANFAVTGYIRDSTGSYIPSFHFMGVELLTGSVIMLCLPWVEKRVHPNKIEAPSH